MKLEDLRGFIKSTEKLVLPERVASTTMAGSMLRKLPLRIQHYIAEKGTRKNPHMSFVVEPYALFLAFEITDIAAAERLLPKCYRLAPTSMFADSSPRPCAIISAFNVHTGVFWGTRVEFYLIAENMDTGLLSWVIVDYESNTHSYDPVQGFIGPSTAHSVVTTSHLGEVIVDVASARSLNALSLIADLGKGTVSALDQRLWVEGNLSVDYTAEDGRKTEPFSLIFDPEEMARAVNIATEDVTLEINTFGQGMICKDPLEVACFPYAQHFVTTIIPAATPLRTVDDLEAAISSLKL